MSKRRTKRRTKRTRKGGKYGNVNPDITDDLRTIIREIDAALDITSEIPSFETLRQKTTDMIRTNDTYPLPVLVAYHRICAPIVQTIRDKIVLLDVDEQTIDNLDEHVSMIQKCMHRIKIQLPLNQRQSRTRPRSRSGSRNRQV